jgi:hypothetical protein
LGTVLALDFLARPGVRSFGVQLRQRCRVLNPLSSMKTIARPRLRFSIAASISASAPDLFFILPQRTDCRTLATPSQLSKRLRNPACSRQKSRASPQ